ncbi:MAG TPA: IS701 family transposase [Thermoanaerobaculia bacterium]|jgi:SRSO17 transposase
MSTVLEHPQAQALLEQATVAPATVARCGRDLTAFLERYLPLFYRDEQRAHAATILRGKLTGLQRKTTEPIASQAGQKRRPLQHFVGAGRWSDPAVRAALRAHVREELADAHAVLVLDNHGVPKKGEDSCGVARQWCGRLGKVDNCQVGYFLAYAGPRGRALIECRLYLPPERAADVKHRAKTYVPDDVAFQEGWRIGLDLLRTSGRELPHAWVTGDDEFGRASEFRALLRLDHERYVLDVPCNTLVRDLSTRRPPSRPGGKERLPLFERVDHWAARQPKGRWRKFRLAGGEKGPREVKALQQWVQTKEEGGVVGPRERLVVIRELGKQAQAWYTLSNAHKEVPLAAVVAAHGQRHRVEELFEEGNQEVGLNHYEVRSWTGWEHQMTLSLLALWFLQVERLRLGGKKSADHGGAGAGDLHGTAAAAPADGAADRGAGQRGAAA